VKNWQELGNGRWKLTITPDEPGDPSPISVYRGTKEEIADQLAESQENSNRRFAEIRRNGQNGAHPTPSPNQSPKPLTATERLQTVAELQNPATVDKGVTRVLESVMGPMEEERQRRQRETARAMTESAVQAASAFYERTPEWYPSEHNKTTLTEYMKRMRLEPTLENFTRSFEELSAAKLLQPIPAEGSPEEVESEEDDTERNAHGQRNAPAATPKPKTPSRVSTGITQRDISGSPPRPTTRLKYSREQLANMSKEDYKQIMLTDRLELERCENFYARQDAEKQRRKVG
jgi:hypothetical protein